MKIAFVNQPIGTIVLPVKSAMTSWAYEVPRRLAQSCDVTVFAKRGRDQVSEEAVDGIKYRRISGLGDDLTVKVLDRFWRLRNARRPLFASSLYYPALVRKTARELSKEPWDVVHIINFSQFVPYVRRMCPKAKIVLHMHCEWLTQLDRGMIERRLEKVDLILGCSDYITNKIRSAFPRFAQRCQTLWNGVDLSLFVPCDSGRTNTDQRPKRLLWAGRISPEKGLHVLIDALPLVLERFPQTQLDIIGGQGIAPREYIVDLSDDEDVRRLICFYGVTDYVSQLKARIRALGVESSVHFNAQCPVVDLPHYYQAADICVFPSVSEAFGMPLAEAMACGKPVVAARTGGMTEIVEHGKTGLLVERADPRALAEALLRILNDDSLARSMGEQGRKRAVECFSWDRTINSLLSYYQAIDETPPDRTSGSELANKVELPGKLDPHEDFQNRPAL